MRDQVAILRRVRTSRAWKVATATSTSSPPSSPWRRLRTPDQRTRRTGAGQQELLPAGRDRGGRWAEVLLAFLGQYYLSHQERDLPAELIVNA